MKYLIIVSCFLFFVGCSDINHTNASRSMGCLISPAVGFGVEIHDSKTSLIHL